MSKSAKFAQGSKLYIAGSASSAVTLTAVTAGPVTTLAITGHTGLANGDVVTFDSNFAGTDAALLNGKIAVVQNYQTGATNDSFTVAINTLGKTITIGTAHCTPAAWTQVKEIKSIKPSGAQRERKDVSDLDSDAREYVLSPLPDNGTFSAECFENSTDPGLLAVRASFDNATTCTYKNVVTGGATRTFDAIVTKFPESPEQSIGEPQTGSIEWQITGPVTRS